MCLDYHPFQGNGSVQVCAYSTAWGWCWQPSSKILLYSDIFLFAGYGQHVWHQVPHLLYGQCASMFAWPVNSWTGHVGYMEPYGTANGQVPGCGPMESAPSPIPTWPRRAFGKWLERSPCLSQGGWEIHTTGLQHLPLGSFKKRMCALSCNQWTDWTFIYPLWVECATQGNNTWHRGVYRKGSGLTNFCLVARVARQHVGPWLVAYRGPDYHPGMCCIMFDWVSGWVLFWPCWHCWWEVEASLCQLYKLVQTGQGEKPRESLLYVTCLDSIKALLMCVCVFWLLNRVECCYKVKAVVKPFTLFVSPCS